MAITDTSLYNIAGLPCLLTLAVTRLAWGCHLRCVKSDICITLVTSQMLLGFHTGTVHLQVVALVQGIRLNDSQT